MSNAILMIHGVTAVTSQRRIFNTFTEIKLEITDREGNTSTVSLMSSKPVHIQDLPFQDVRTADEAVPA